MSDLRERVEDLRRRGGYWTPTLDPLIEMAPEFVEAYVSFAAHPHRAQHLSAKARSFVGLAVHAAATHLHEHGVRLSIRSALDAGASTAEIIEVLELTATLGVHACVFGVPILVEELGGVPPAPPGEEAKRERLKADFIAKRGYWNDGIWAGLLALDADYFQAFTAFSSAPWATTQLEPKLKELIYIAFDVSATHQFAPGTPIHMRNAMRYGATPGEILEVMQIASIIGIHSFEIALPILIEELQRLKPGVERAGT
jgi:alkylhydroperoxidase/carboxymuconolactone decarboxylase family protein YurZ